MLQSHKTRQRGFQILEWTKTKHQEQQKGLGGCVQNKMNKKGINPELDV